MRNAKLGNHLKTKAILRHELKESFCGQPGTEFSKLKNLQFKLSLQENSLRKIDSVSNFAEALELTEEEWKQLFNFLVPTLTQIERKV